MSFTKWMNKRVARLDWLDISLIKWSVFFFALLLAKVYPVFLALEWYWYVLLFVAALIRPMKRAYF